MRATRWVGAVRVDVEHLGPTSVDDFHGYAVTATPSSGGRWRYEGAWAYEPDERGVDHVVAELACAVAQGAVYTPETFGGEQTYLDLAELLETGLASPDGPWPVRRTEHGVAVLVDVAAEDARVLADDLPMRVEVADRGTLFSYEPHSRKDADVVRAALAQVAGRGAQVLSSNGGFQISHPDLEFPRRVLVELLCVGGFSGRVQINGEDLEYSDGRYRAAGWEHRTAQLELRLVAHEESDAQILVALLADLANRPDVADLDVDTTEGGFHVLASVANPEPFLNAARDALQRSGFRGAADLSAAGRWRFEPGNAQRLDHGVAL